VKTIAVAGAAICDDSLAEVAYQVGYEAASRGFAVLTGGLAGVMEHALRGAKDAGGLTIGVIPSYDKSTANDFCDVVIPTGLGHGRNILVASSGDICVSVGGELGTASEIAIAKKLGRQLISYNPPLKHEDGYNERDLFFNKLIELLERL
jgi:uncharacterized protein (TIGR00725 family)